MNILRNILTIAAIMPAALWGAEYSTTVNLPASLNGKMAVLSDVDTGQPVDSVAVKDGKAIFPNDGTNQYLGALQIGETEVAWLIVGGANVTMNRREWPVKSHRNKRRTQRRPQRFHKRTEPESIPFPKPAGQCHGRCT